MTSFKLDLGTRKRNVFVTQLRLVKNSPLFLCVYRRNERSDECCFDLLIFFEILREHEDDDGESDLVEKHPIVQEVRADLVEKICG